MRRGRRARTRTGAVYVMASTPTYDPNQVDKRTAPRRCRRSRPTARGGAPLLNRATQGLYTPGSTFKVVTAAAALETSAFTPDSGFNDPGYCTEYGKQVSNAGNPDQGGPEVVRAPQARAGAPALGQLGLLQHRQADRRRHDPRVREEVRLLQDAAARDAARTSASPSGLYNGTQLFDPRTPRRRSTPAGSRSARSACS